MKMMEAHTQNGLSEMKRYHLFMVAAFVAASVMFVGCEKEDDTKPKPAPEILSFKVNNVDVEKNNTVTVKVGDVVQIKVLHKAEGTEYELVRTVPTTEAGHFVIKTSAVDKQDPPLTGPEYIVFIDVE